MRIFNEEKTQELNKYDSDLGYLKNDVLITHHEEIKWVDEQGHYETIAEYPNGGKDVKWVVDVEGVKYQPAHDEEEPIYVYVEYTKKELKKLNAEKRIVELKELLADTDYKAIKYSEGELTFEEYEETKLQRRAWREEINRLEGEIEEA